VSEEKQVDVAIVGGGPAGMAAAIAARRAEYEPAGHWIRDQVTLTGEASHAIPGSLHRRVRRLTL
jgi:thioredoxin reductase